MSRVLVRRLVLGDLQANCFLAEDGRGGPVLVIDPGGEAQRVLDALEGTEVAAIVLTHAHFDHLGAAGEVIRATGAPLLIHEIDAPRIVNPAPEGTGAALFGYSETAPPADRLLAEGDLVEAGEVALEVLHTPGHTEGCICLFGHGHLFSGDTLFAGSVGRTDFPTGDMAAMQKSIARLAGLPPETVVHAGHGPDTTIGREREINPFFPRA